MLEEIKKLIENPLQHPEVRQAAMLVVGSLGSLMHTCTTLSVAAKCWRLMGQAKALLQHCPSARCLSPSAWEGCCCKGMW